MSLKIVVLAKQVPDTRNVGKDAMTAEGTVNRAALPAIFNPEDLNALEQALRLKEQNPGSTVGVLTMGPPRAAEIIRQGLYRGADTGWLLTDRLFAGADTLATSYALATAIKKIGEVDIVIGGRQAIDGDTAQVGPQVAQKLGLNQVTYAEEILDPWFSHGLDPILKERSYKLSGILNGIDTKNYDPETDKDIFFNFSAKEPENKAKNKAALQELFSLPVNAYTPVIGIVSRLVSHKGFDLIKRVMWEILETTDVQLAVLGSGDWEYESFFKELAAAFPEKVGLRLGFVPDMARKIYAGSDIFLMPSKSEPCGLSQMVALRYGSIPIVRETGGLKDTITDSGDGKGNGFTFKSYDAYDMLDAIRRALAAYSDKKQWAVLVKRALKCDNSWGKSAKEYIALYEELLAD